jgi:hypothetical protein
VIPAANAGRRTGAAARERTATMMMDILFHGVGWTDIALTLNRIAVGMFFMLSGYHKLFNPERHRAFADELKELGVHAVGFNQWWVPTVEFSATSGRQRIKDYKPIDEADRIDDWLYLPEVLYAFMLIMVVSAGAGPYSLDALILGLIGKHGA